MSKQSDSDRPLDASRRTLLRRAMFAAGGVAGFSLTPPTEAAPKKSAGHAVAAAAAPVPAASPPVEPTARSIDDVVKGFEKLDGMLTLYRKKNDLYAEIKRDDLNKPFLLQATRATGTAGPGGTAGDPLNDIVLTFQRMNDRIYLAEPNLLFRARAASPEQASVERSFAEGFLAAYSIEAVRPDPAQAKANAAIKDTLARQDALQKTALSYLIHIPSLFLTDAPNFTSALSGFAIDADKTYLSRVKNFPGNLTIVTRYVFSGKGAGSPLLPDGRSFPEDVAYNLFPLRDTGYKPRFYDDRIGFFTEDYQTFDEDMSPDNARRMILRWHLVKKDPKAAVSEPVTPITFWIDNATPLRYRDAVREGVLLWNAAFEPLGFKDAVRCEVMPADAGWDPADMSHNVIRWASSPAAGYAVAQFRHSPLTGQIVNASITVDASMARFSNLSYPTTFLTGQPADGVGPALSPAQVADRLMNTTPTSLPSNRCECHLGMGAMQGAAFGWDCLTLSDDAMTVDAPTLAEYTHQYLRQVVAHEMGHCMGLRHNFKGSTMLSPTQLQDKALTAKYGVSGSVMDYLPANMPPLGGTRADLYMPCVGLYDKWAIAYGYTDFGDTPGQEDAGLAAIAARSHEFGHIYASDENADTVDPSITRFDLGADALAFRVAMVERAHHLLGTLEYRFPATGQPFYELTRVFMRILNQYSSNALAVARFVGGVVTYRSHAGDPGSGVPVQPVPFADQRRALHVLRQYLLTDKALQFSPTLLAKLEQNPVPFSPLTTALPPTDFSILDAISFTQSTSLLSILNPATLGRIETNEFRVGARRDALTVLETMQSLTDAVWKELDGKKHALPPLRRRLQRTHVDALVALFVHPTGNDAGAYAQATLRALVPKLAAAEAISHDPTTVAHLAETRTRIVRSLHAQAIV